MSAKAEVKLVADLEELDSGSRKAASTVEAATAKIHKSLEQVSKDLNKVALDAAVASSGLQKIAAPAKSVETALSQIKPAALTSEMSKLGAQISNTMQEMPRGVGGSTLFGTAIADLKTKVGMTDAGMYQLGLTIGRAIVPMAAVAVAVAAATAAFGTLSIRVNETVTNLAKDLNSTANEAGAFALAIVDAGGSISTLTQAAEGLGKVSRTNESDLNKMGVTTRETTGRYRELKDILLDAVAVANTYAEGIDRDLAVQKMFGGQLKDSSALLKLNAEAIADATSKQRVLGLEIGKEGTEAYKRHNAALLDLKQSFARLSEVMVSIGVQIGNALAPAIDWLIQALGWTLRKATEAVIVVWSAFRIKIELVKSSFEYLKETIQYFCSSSMAQLERFADTAQAALTMRPEAMSAAWEAGTKKIEQVEAQHFENRAAIIANGKKKISDIWNGTEASKEDSEKFGKKGKQFSSEDFKKPKTPESRISNFEAELAQQKIALERKNQQDNTFFKMSASEEAAFWQKKMQIAGISQKDLQEIEKRYLAAATQAREQAFQAQIAEEKLKLEEARQNGNERIRIAINIEKQMSSRFGSESREAKQAAQERVRIEQQVANEIQKINDEIANGKRKKQLDEITVLEQQADFEVQLGVKSQTQRLQDQIRFEEQKNLINQQAAEAALLAAEKDTFEYQRRLEQKLEAERQFQLRLNVLKKQAELQQTASLRAGAQSLSQSWGQTLARMATLQQGFASGIRSLWQGLTGVIGNALAKMIEKWLAKQLTSLIVGRAASSVANVAQVMSLAAVAAAAAFASTAAIPIVGPALAPAAAAAAYGSTAAFAPLASARRGFDIPAGLNPITQLHEKEMVLPQEQADAVRNMTGENTGKIEVHVHTVDPKSAAQFFRDNPRIFVDALKEARRNGMS